MPFMRACVRRCDTVGRGRSTVGQDDRRPVRRSDGAAQEPGGAAANRGYTHMERSTSAGGGGRRTRSAAHELARYEELFAARTLGMKSSAMREMMALTERPDVISLAGGLPDTTTFPPELYAKLMAEVAAESTARALQYGPTEGMAT